MVSLIDWLPVDPFALFKEYGWIVLPWSEVRSEENPDPFLLKKSKADAKVVRKVMPDREIYIVVYNDSKPPNRIRFTIAHEIGHIVLGHLTDFEDELYRLDNSKYEVLEKEANTFAAEILAPMPVLVHIGASNREDIMQLCDITRLAAEARESSISMFGDKFQTTRDNEWIIPQFDQYIQSLLCDAKEDHQETQVNDIAQIYRRSGIPTDVNNRLLFCPRCGHDSFSYEARFCTRCGEHLFNFCTNRGDLISDGCGQLASGEDCFCQHCGSETHLYRQGYLLSWEEIEDGLQEVAATLSTGRP